LINKYHKPHGENVNRPSECEFFFAVDLKDLVAHTSNQASALSDRPIGLFRLKKSGSITELEFTGVRAKLVQ
jgi:hypothetical protein